MKIGLITLLGLCGSMLAVEVVRAEVFIVHQGQPQAEIITAVAPARMTRLAAAELQKYVEKISGARLPLVTEPTGQAVPIYVGVSSHTRRLGLAVDDLRDGAFRMASGDDWLALLGPDCDFEPIEPWGQSRRRPEQQRVQNEWDRITGDFFKTPFFSLHWHYYRNQEVWDFDDAGTLNAVYAFLHDLGARWYAPGEIGEVLPQLADIPLPPANRTVRPAFPLRKFQFTYSQHGLGEVGEWCLRLGFTPGASHVGHVQLCHGMKFVLEHPEMFEKHPEMYMLRDGKRHDNAPCLSSPLLFEKHLAYARALFDHYNEPMVNIDLPDGFGLGCQCEGCGPQRTPERGRDGTCSDLVFGYIDRLARELYRSHPDRMVSGLIYSSYRMLPEKIDRFSPNLVLIWSRASKRRSLYRDREDVHAYLDQRERWLERLPSKTLIMWESYISKWSLSVFPRAIAEDIRGQQGVTLGDTVEVYQHQTYSNYEPVERKYAYDAFALNHLNLYVTARGWWEPDLDIEALLEEYYRLYYGPAQDRMREFLEYCEQRGWELSKDLSAIERALELSEAVQAAVDPTTIYGRRVARVAEYARPLYALRDQLQRAPRENIMRLRALRSEPLARKPLDGSLDDPRFWPQVRTLNLRSLRGGRTPPELRTWTRIFRAGNFLVFGIHCGEPDMAGLRPAVRQDAQVDMTQADYVEILLETTSHFYYRLRIDSDGTMQEADMGDGKEELRWRSGAEVATHKGAGFWSVELRLPLGGDGLREEEPLSGVDGRMPSSTFPWYVNVGRQRVRDGESSRYSLVVTESDEIAVPEKFAELWSK